ncbi:hypothetical protein LCGC14_0893210 [marine sediment metagenome]|uniref:Uncharacterized protein n=1 Tax=marine sediment metagenome TaxID=412755 RepID=A0A0F9S5K6_9ZZZZ
MSNGWCNYNVASRRVTSDGTARQLLLPGNPRRIFFGVAGVSLASSVIVHVKAINPAEAFHLDPIIMPGWRLAGISGNNTRSFHYNYAGPAVTEEMYWQPPAGLTVDVTEISTDEQWSSQFPDEYNCNNTYWRAWESDKPAADEPVTLLESNPRRVALIVFPPVSPMWLAFGGPKNGRVPHYWLGAIGPQVVTFRDIGPMIHEPLFWGTDAVPSQRMWILEVFGV